jgi:hypothetical protein
MTLRIRSPMDQKSIVLYLHMKRMALGDLHEDLVRVLGEIAIADSTITKYVGSARFPPKQDAPSAEPMPVETTPVDQAILTAFADSPFSSLREFSRLTCLPRSTVRTHLARSLHFTIRHLQWIPHFLDTGQKLASCPMSSHSSARQWHDVVTLDESLFYLRSNQDLIWTGAAEIVPDRERYTIQSPKFMMTIV